MGFENITNKLVKAGTSANGFTASLMVSIPTIKIAKPIKIVPTSFRFAFLENKRNTTPISASTGANELGLRS